MPDQAFALPPSHGYCGRFAPSPTGPLHAGSLVAALASWLDARAHGGRWLVRIEDIDPPRCQPGADHFILSQLASCGLLPDAPPVWQSARHALYAQALSWLERQQLAYPCGCTRKQIEQAWSQLHWEPARHLERPYPGTCRLQLQGAARSWRFRLTEYLAQLAASAPTSSAWSCQAEQLHWQDRRLGAQSQAPAQVAGDFVLRRADGLYAYQLAVVVDDALQGITDVVRGADLTDNTPRQLLLQQALGLPAPRYLHTPLVCQADGEKLSKQHGAQAVDLSEPLAALNQAAGHLGLAPASPGTALAHALHGWVQSWAASYNAAL